MLAKRIIATVLVANGMVVQSRQFKHTNVIGNVKTVIKFFDQWDADEIIILDVSREKDPNFLKIVEEGSKKCFVPMAVGGWIKSLDDIRDALNAGADKVVINTEAYKRPEFIREATEKFGSQCIIVSIDHNGEYVYINRAKDLITQERDFDLKFLKPEMNLEDYIKMIIKCLPGEIYLTSISRDGKGQGYDIKTLSYLLNEVDIEIPIIISGGCGHWKHLSEAFDAGADGCSIANRLHFSESSIKEAKKYLMERGYPIRRSVN